MPQEPKRRHSRQRQGKRRAAITFLVPNGVACQNCGAINLPHTVCKACGLYKGRQVLTIKPPKQEKTNEKPS